MITVVLGANGFIGSHLVEALLAQQEFVVAVASYRSDGKMGWLDLIPDQPGLVKRRGDITDATFVRALAPNKSTTLVFNLAAYVSVPGSLTLPERYWETNATAVLRLLQLYDAARIVQISTSEVFSGASSPDTPYQLDSMLGPVSWYGAAKAASEMLVRASNKPDHIFVRLFNTYGPRQYPRAVIPHMIREAMAVQQSREASLGDPAAIRGFHFVRDIAQALSALVWCPWQGHMQWASQSPMTMQVLWELVASLVGVDSTKAKWNPEQRPSAIRVQALFGERSQNLPDPIAEALGQTPLLQGIADTYQWILNHPNFAAQGYYQ